MPPLLGDIIHARACKPKCEKFLTRPLMAEISDVRRFDRKQSLVAFLV